MISDQEFQDNVNFFYKKNSKIKYKKGHFLHIKL